MAQTMPAPYRNVLKNPNGITFLQARFLQQLMPL